MASDLVDKGIIIKEETLLHTESGQLDQLLHPAISPSRGEKPIIKGLPASPGAVVDEVVFSADIAMERGGRGEAVVLMCYEITPDDIYGVIVTQGVLTTHGGMISHAAAVVRGMGKPCAAGASGIHIDVRGYTLTVGDRVTKEGEVIILNGSAGDVFRQKIRLIPPRINEDFQHVVTWTDGVRELGMRASTDNSEDVSKARELGAEGIGLCRTRHIFTAADRLPATHRMILAKTRETHADALEKILSIQQAGFEGIFTAIRGLPVIVQLLDSPLHELLSDLAE